MRTAFIIKIIIIIKMSTGKWIIQLIVNSKNDLKDDFYNEQAHYVLKKWWKNLKITWLIKIWLL